MHMCTYTYKNMHISDVEELKSLCMVGDIIFMYDRNYIINDIFLVSDGNI